MWLLTLALAAALGPAPQAALGAPAEGDFIIRNFAFTSGETLPELRMFYRTYGTPRKDASGRVVNAVLIMHGTTGSGAQFVRDEFAGELFGPGQPLDAARYYIILPDDIGHGQSSKPSDGLRAKFPRYGYVDMVTAEHRLVTEGLGVNHLRLVMGTSMGGMHTWMWGTMYPDFMDALEKIRAPLLAINSADDIINPPELGILEREVKRVPRGRAIVLPLSERTAGHGTHTLAAQWKAHLIELLKATER